MVRQRLLTLIHQDTTVENFQKFFGVYKKGDKVEINNYFFYYLFQFGGQLGNEEFYIPFFSFLLWNQDTFKANQLLILWSTVMYIGQFIKDLLKLPRPTSPKVAKLEHHYETEYGLPSTHAMVAITLPFYFTYLYIEENQTFYNILLITIAILWFIIMTLSRLYLGVHSIYDILSGILLGLFILWIQMNNTRFDLKYILEMESFQCFILLSSILFSLVYIYPTKFTDKWTNAYGDTTLILSSTISYTFGSNLLYQNQYVDLLYLDKSNLVYKMILKTLIGFIILISLRLLVKFIMIQILTRIVSKSNENPNQRYIIEIPTKIVVYSMIGMTTSVFIPYLFYLVHLK